jgi:hypothetical protein
MQTDLAQQLRNHARLHFISSLEGRVRLEGPAAMPGCLYSHTTPMHVVALLHTPVASRHLHPDPGSAADRRIHSGIAMFLLQQLPSTGPM